jgi:hypothetical protein
MKVNIVTQVYNEENRIKDWLDYHKKIGINSIIVFDDLSIDTTFSVISEYSKKDPSIILKKSDKTIKQNITYSSGNDYSGNEEIYWRVVRSYNEGLKYFKQFEDSILFFIDVDEFLVPVNSNNIEDALKGKEHYERFFVPSYDMKPPNGGYFTKEVPVWEQSTYTWSTERRKELKSGWDCRVKNAARTDTIESTLINFWHVHSADVGQYIDGIIPSNFQTSIANYSKENHKNTPWNTKKHCFLGEHLRGSAFGIENNDIFGDLSLIMLHFRNNPQNTEGNYDWEFKKINDIMKG